MINDPETQQGPGPGAGRIRRVVLLVAMLNFAYFFVEFGVAVAIRSVSLLADSVGFLEDTAVNLLIFVALGWSLRARSRMGKILAGIILLPALAAAWEAISRFQHPGVPDPTSLVLTAGGAIVVNAACALLLVQIRHHSGSMGRAAFLAARNDVFINAAIIAMVLLTWWTHSGWPDLILGVLVIVLNLGAAKEVWEVAEEESLATKALAGEDIDDAQAERHDPPQLRRTRFGNAQLWSERSADAKVEVGACLAPGHTGFIHAEVNALLAANWNGEGHTLLVTPVVADPDDAVPAVQQHRPVRDGQVRDHAQRPRAEVLVAAEGGPRQDHRHRAAGLRLHRHRGRKQRVIRDDQHRRRAAEQAGAAQRGLLRPVRHGRQGRGQVELLVLRHRARR